MLSGYAGISSLEVEQLDIKHQGGVRRDAAGDALGAVAHVWADGKLCSLAPGHLGNALVPASNDLVVISIDTCLLSFIRLHVSPRLYPG